MAFLVRFKVRVGRNILLAELPQDIFDEMDMRIGEEIFLVLKLKWLKVIQ